MNNTNYWAKKNSRYVEERSDVQETDKSRDGRAREVGYITSAG
jgi:hypothetical protein